MDLLKSASARLVRGMKDLMAGRVRLEILVLIVVVFWLLWGHLIAGTCKVPLVELFGVKGGRIAEGFSELTSNPALTNTPPPAASKPPKREGFTDFASVKSPSYIQKPDTWGAPTLTYSPGTTPDAGVQSIWNRPKQPVPLPSGQMDMLATTPFKPECCPNAYSTSTGCACMTMDQYNALHTRFGNNVPFSEY